jgi:hypothetical protein
MGRGQTSRQTNKNASQQCGAFGAENETRTITYNMLIINDLQETEETTGET